MRKGEEYSNEPKQNMVSFQQKKTATFFPSNDIAEVVRYSQLGQSLTKMLNSPSHSSISNLFRIANAYEWMLILDLQLQFAKFNSSSITNMARERNLYGSF